MMTRFESIVQGCLEELDRQRSIIANDPHLRSVQIVVELVRGKAMVSVSIKSARPGYPIQEPDARNLVPDRP